MHKNSQKPMFGAVIIQFPTDVFFLSSRDLLVYADKKTKANSCKKTSQNKIYRLGKTSDFCPEIATECK